MRRRKHRRGAVAHIYQLGFKGRVLFYSPADRLFFLTIIYRFAKKHNVKIISISLMINHVHILVMADSQKIVSDFVDEYSTAFARGFNETLERRGHVFKPIFGLADKVGNKKIRTAVAYVLNNPVEKGIVNRAAEWRWNLLPYSLPDGVFSRKIRRDRASLGLRNAMSYCDSRFEEGLHVPLKMLDLMMRRLNPEERELLCDHIVRTFSPVDYLEAARFWNSFEDMIIAVDSNTGSEYDIAEDFDPSPDTVYDSIAEYVAGNVCLKNPREVVVLPCEEKERLANEMLALRLATPEQIRRFLHL